MMMDIAYEQTRALLDTEVVISCSWVSNNFKLSPTHAVECLNQLKEHETSLHASYLVCGQDNQGSLSYKLVSEDQLAGLKESFRQVFNQQLYCLHKTSLDYETLASSIVDANLLLADRLLKETSVDEPRERSYLFNAFSTVRAPLGLSVKPLGARFLSSMNRSNQGQASVSLPVAQPAAQSKPFFGSEAKASAPSKASLPAPPVPSSAPSADLPPHSATASASPAKAVGSRLKKRPVSKEDSEEEWSDGEGGQSKARPPRPSPSKKTPLPPKPSPLEEEEEVAEETPEKKKAKKVNLLVRGAMDDYMEDVAIEQHLRNNNNPGNPSGETEKKKTRKLVEKTFQDEKGFFVTEMVYEEVTDDEGGAGGRGVKIGGGEIGREKENSENKDSSSSSAPKVLAKAVPADKSKGAKKTGGTGAPQKNMMSFFNKK